VSTDRGRLYQPCSYPHQEPYSIEATGRRCGDSRSIRLPSIPTYRSNPIDASRGDHHPTTFYLQGNDASLQLVPASTTTKANRADKMISGTADHRSESRPNASFLLHQYQTTGRDVQRPSFLQIQRERCTTSSINTTSTRQRLCVRPTGSPTTRTTGVG
jgi:hypothetical protein